MRFLIREEPPALKAPCGFIGRGNFHIEKIREQRRPSPVEIFLAEAQKMQSVYESG